MSKSEIKKMKTSELNERVVGLEEKIDKWLPWDNPAQWRFPQKAPYKHLSWQERLARAKEMRKNPTPAEKRFNYILKRTLARAGVPYKNKWDHGYVKRQALKCGYILDFYFTNVRIAVEIDGPIHETRRDYDKRRDARLKKKRITVIHFTNDEVFAGDEVLAEKVVRIVKSRIPKRRKLSSYQRYIERKQGKRRLS